MARFESIFNKYVTKQDYKYNPKLSITENVSNLRRMAFLENSCRTLYERTEGVFGESYADRILESVLQKKLTVTAFEYYPNPDVQFCENRVYLKDLLLVVPKPMKGHVGSLTLITFFTTVMQELLYNCKYGGNIELFDFFICLSMYIEKWIRVNYPKGTTGLSNNISSDELLSQVIKHVIYSMFSKPSEINHITLSIMDRRVFEKIAFKTDYALPVGLEGDIIYPNYNSYVKTIETFLKFLSNTKNSQQYVQPNVRVYAMASNKTRPEIIEYIAGESGMHESVISDIFKNIQFDAMPQDLSSPEYLACWEKLEELKTPKKVDWHQIRINVRLIFEKDYIQYLNYVDKKLAFLFHTMKVDEIVSSLEVYYVKKHDNMVLPTNLQHYTSEVQIEFSDIVEGTKSREEYTDRLIHAYLDAQAINQVRDTFVKKKKGNRYHVKINNVDPDLISYTYTVLSEQTTWLKNTYNLNFTFSICQRMFFRDKGRKCYLLL